MASSHSPAGLVVAFDDDHAVANAGLLLPATLAERLGIEAVIDELVNLGDRPGASPAWPQGVDPDPRAGGRWRLHRRRRGAAHRVHRPGARPPGDGALDAGDVPARLHLRAHPPARPRRRDPHGQGVGGGCRARRAADDHRRGLHDLRGPRPPQGRRRLRLHPPAWLPPAAGHPGRHRRGPARPPAHRAGRVWPWRRAVRQRAGRPGPPRRRQRAADPAGRLGLLVSQGAGRLPPPPHPVLDHRAPDQDRRSRDRRHRRARLGRHRLPRRRRRAGRRDHPWSATG